MSHLLPTRRARGARKASGARNKWWGPTWEPPPRSGLAAPGTGLSGAVGLRRGLGRRAGFPEGVTAYAAAKGLSTRVLLRSVFGAYPEDLDLIVCRRDAQTPEVAYGMSFQRKDLPAESPDHQCKGMVTSGCRN